MSVFLLTNESGECANAFHRMNSVGRVATHLRERGDGAQPGAGTRTTGRGALPAGTAEAGSAACGRHRRRVWDDRLTWSQLSLSGSRMPAAGTMAGGGDGY